MRIPAGRTRARVRARLATAGLVALLILNGCASSLQSPAPSDGPVTNPAADLDADDVVELLARAGIATFDDVLDATPQKDITEPASPVALIRWQAENLAGEAAAGGGIPGTQLDALGSEVGLTEEHVPVSYLLAGWLTQGETAGAQAAIEVLGERDWANAPAITYPNLVLLLFFADLAAVAVADAGTAARDRQRTGSSVGLEGQLARIAPLPPGPADPPAATCPDLQQWVDDVLGTIFGALKLPTGDGVLGFLTGLWNAGLEWAKEQLSNLITTVGAPIIAIVKAVAVAVGAIAYFASFLNPWAVKLESTGPEGNHFAHPDEPDHDFEVTATIVTDQTSWEATVVDCARQAGVTLPDPSVNDKRVVWYEDHNADKPLVERLERDDRTDADGVASSTYRTMRESPFDVRGEVFEGTLGVTATVYRIEASETETLINKIFTSTDAGDALKAILGEVIGDIAGMIGAQARATGKLQVPIAYHQAGGVCLDGVWELELPSARNLIEALAGDAFFLTGLGGSVTRVYLRNGRFIERHDGFLVETRAIIGTIEHPLHVVDTAIVMSGHSTGKYDVESLDAAETTVTYSALEPGAYVTVGTVTVDETVSTATELTGAIEWASNGARTVSCSAHEFTETWGGGQYSLRWFRVADSDAGDPDDPVERPEVLSTTASVKLNVGGLEKTLYGGTCLLLPMGSQRYFNLEIVYGLESPDATIPPTPNPSLGTQVLADQFILSIPVDGDGGYDFGAHPPTGRLEGAVFQLEPEGTVFFERNQSKGRFSGKNVKVFGGEDVRGEFSCY